MAATWVSYEIIVTSWISTKCRQKSKDKSSIINWINLHYERAFRSPRSKIHFQRIRVHRLKVRHTQNCKNKNGSVSINHSRKNYRKHCRTQNSKKLNWQEIALFGLARSYGLMNATINADFVLSRTLNWHILCGFSVLLFSLKIYF